MATKYLHKFATEAEFLGSSPDRGNAQGFAVVGDKVVENVDGAVVELVDESTAQTLTNKTLTSPVLTSPSITEAAELVTATNVITAAESGKTFFLDAAAGFLSTLPAPALGLRYRFVVKTAPTSNGYTIDPNGGTADIIVVNVVSQADASAGITDDNADLLTLVANQAVVGDWLDVVCDGTKWHVTGQVKVTAGLTSATT